MIVMKFGGTSVQDASAIGRVIGIVRKELPRMPIVVVSACSGVTNDLLKAARLVKDGNQEASLGLLEALRARHRIIATECCSPATSGTVCERIDAYIARLANYVRGIHLLGELTDRTLDAFVGHGEQLSSLIIAQAMNDQGVPARLVDAHSVMKTDASYSTAVPDMEATAQGAQREILPVIQSGKVVVTQGFIGSAPDGTPTTIGRGGSDLSASIIGSVLPAEEIQIWTDVDGMMTSDPRIIPHARLISIMSFAEASELAYFGAKVLHPRTILPAVEKCIPVKILNSHRPDGSGTMILAQPPHNGGASGQAGSITSIASKPGITVINVASSRMLMAHGFLARLFSIFAEYGKSVDVISTSEVSVSLTIDNEERLEEIRAALGQIGDVRIIRSKAIVCVVGEGMKSTPGIGARILTALARAGVNIEMVSEGASEINLTLVVDKPAAVLAVRVLHEEFFGA
jgi:aspartate kinase